MSLNASQSRIIKSGRFDWRLLDKNRREIRRGSFKNGMTTAGLTAALSVELGAGTQVTAWYMGLVDNSGWTAFAAGDTMGSHSGWVELTDYDEATREALTFAAASGGVINTSAAAEFTLNASVAIKGAFITSISTKGGTTGTLRATGAFSNVQNFTSGQIFQINYSSQNSAG